MDLGDCCMYDPFFPNALALRNDLSHNPERDGQLEMDGGSLPDPSCYGIYLLFPDVKDGGHLPVGMTGNHVPMDG